MVLAQIIKRRQLEQGREQGAEQARLEYTEQLRTWAKERGIPLDELPEFGKPTNSLTD